MLPLNFKKNLWFHIETLKKQHWNIKFKMLKFSNFLRRKFVAGAFSSLKNPISSLKSSYSKNTSD